jgi:hypothetical protein
VELVGRSRHARAGRCAQRASRGPFSTWCGFRARRQSVLAGRNAHRIAAHTRHGPGRIKSAAFESSAPTTAIPACAHSPATRARRPLHDDPIGVAVQSPRALRPHAPGWAEMPRRNAANDKPSQRMAFGHGVSARASCNSKRSSGSRRRRKFPCRHPLSSHGPHNRAQQASALALSARGTGGHLAGRLPASMQA